ncbi:Alpha-amylase [Hordeum vulgare]|nr:Alpha-amylase [Hordeum vulgare]
MDMEHILKIRTSPRQRDDFLSWFPKRSGVFSVKSPYKLATCDHNVAFANGSSSSNPEGKLSLWNQVWSANVPQTMNITAWIVITGTLVTQQCKNYRQLATRSLCPLYGVEEETTFHALVACTHARILWINMRRRWPLPNDDLLIDNGKEWLMLLLSSCSVVVRDMIVMLICRIWQIRNDINHGKEAPPVLATLEFLDSYYKSINLAGKFQVKEIIKGKMPSVPLAVPHQKVTAPALPWPAPAQGTVALSVDSSYQPVDGTTAAGMVLRNSEGVILFAAYRYIFHCNDPLEAELHAMMQGMALVIQQSSSPMMLQSDSSEALSCLSMDTLRRSAYGQLGMEIKHLCGSREFIL